MAGWSYLSQQDDRFCHLVSAFGMFFDEDKPLFYGAPLCKLMPVGGNHLGLTLHHLLNAGGTFHFFSIY
jgi:hypothetical protein